MGFRFRRSWGVIPGVRLNLGLKSGSVSFGVRGLHYTVGTRGSRVTLGLPGTGLYWTQKVNSPFGARQLGGPRQMPGQAARAGTPPVMNQAAQLAGAQTPRAPQFTRPNQSPMQAQAVHAPQFTRPNQPPTQLRTAIGALSGPAALKHVFIPGWLVWAVLAVIAVAALCFCAGAIGQLVR
jgi:hypothetical protein